MASLDYTPDKTVAEFIADYTPGELFYSFIIGPVGCIAGSTLVLTEHGAIPMSDIDRPMRVLSWNAKTCQFQLSLSSGSFPKGRDYLYRVTTPEGEFDVAAKHRLLCADGEYRLAEELRQGDVLASYSRSQHPTIEGLSLLESREGAPHYSQISVDSLGRYAESARLRGRRFLLEEDICQDAAPLPADALGYEGCFCREAAGHVGDLSERTHTHTHQAQFYDLLQMTRFGCRSASRVAAEVARTSAVFFSHVEGLTRELKRSLQNCVTRLRESSLCLRFPWLSEICSCAAPSLSVSKSAIISVQRVPVKQAFWDMCIEDTHNYVTVDGAIHHNSGKTTGALMKIPHMAKLQAPSPVDGIRRTKFVIVRNTFSQLRDTSIASWNYWFKDGQAGQWKATKNEFVMRFDDVECVVLFRALDTPDDVNRVLSLEITGAILDEFTQIPKEIVEALSGRCGRYPPKIDGGCTNFGIWGSSNPGETDSFWHTFLVDDRPANVAYFHQPSGLSDRAENLHNLPAGYYDNLVKGKSSAWVEVYAHANWGFSVAGKPVVPMFKREIHVHKTNLTPDKYLPIVIGFDPGMHSALIFGQMDRYGRLCVIDELILEGYGAVRMCTDRLVPLINQKYRDFEMVIAPDPASNSRTPTNETTVLQVLRDSRFKKYWSVKVGSTNLIAPRLEAIDHFTTRLTENGPALVIDPRCRTIIKALASGWRYEQNKRSGEDRDTPEKNSYSHPGDAFGYLCQYFSENSGRQARAARNAPYLQAPKNNYIAR